MDSPFQYGKQTDKARSLIFAGFIEAIIVASWLCDLPESSTLSWPKVLLITVKYVVMPTLAAGVGAWTFQNLRANSSLSYNMLVTLAGTGWVLVTPTVLFYKQDSPWMMLSIAIAAVFTAISLRGLLPNDEIPSFANLKSAKAPASLLFMEPVYNGSSPWKAFYLSLGFYAAVLAFCTGYLFTSGLLLAACVFAVAWSLILPPSTPPDIAVRKKQLAWVTALALLLTCFALLPWMPLTHVPKADASTKKAHNTVSASERKLTGISGFGYQGIVLWTIPQKKDPLPPAPSLFSMQSGRSAKPLIIPFDGAYWYFQAPNISPGQQAHVAKGDPLAVSIRSNDFLPLLMEAHQHLGAPIKLSCCRELKIDIRNGELHPGNIHLGVALTDSLTPGKPSQYLGEQPVLSSQSARTSPTDETVTFAIPAHSDIRSFDEITVLITPTAAWSTAGTKIAVQQFALVPR